MHNLVEVAFVFKEGDGKKKEGDGMKESAVKLLTVIQHKVTFGYAPSSCTVQNLLTVFKNLSHTTSL